MLSYSPGVTAATSGSDTLAFEVLGKLGSGGMGRVDLARRASDPSGSLVAVKRLHDELVNDQEFVQMFVDEARITASIQHENVVSTVGWGIDEHGLFLATEFVRGASLRDLVRVTPLPERLAAYVCARVAAGLHAAHTRGVVHRDVSPANILIGLNGDVKIADFGIARALSSGRRTQSGVLKGKIPYMSIEQLKSGPLDGRSDLYSLGVVMFEALTSERPHPEGGNDIELLARVLTTPTPSLRERAPHIDPDLAAIVDRLLSTDRDARPRDGLELERLLEDWLATRGGSRAEVARMLGERVAASERGSHRTAEAIEEREREGAPEVVTIHTNMSSIRTRTPSPTVSRHDKRIREQPFAMLVVGVVVGLVVAIFVGQAASLGAAPRHRETAKPLGRPLNGQIQCGDTLTCDPHGSLCCEHTITGRYECVASVTSCSDEGDVPIRCSGPDSCAAQGHAGQVCCAYSALFSGQACTRPIEVSCKPSCGGNDHFQVGCTTGACGADEKCVASDCSMPGYDICVLR